MEMHAHPDSPAFARVQLLDPTDTDLRHAQKRARGLSRDELPTANRATRRKLARMRQRRTR
jgi:hypothetical protein